MTATLQRGMINADDITVFDLGSGVIALDTNGDARPTQADAQLYKGGGDPNDPQAPLQQLVVSAPGLPAFSQRDFTETRQGTRYETVSVPLDSGGTLHLARNKVGWASTVNRAVQRAWPERFDTLIWGGEVLVNAPYFYEQAGIEKRFEAARLIGYLPVAEYARLVQHGHDVGAGMAHLTTSAPHRVESGKKAPLPLAAAVTAAAGRSPPFRVPPRLMGIASFGLQGPRLEVAFPFQPTLGSTPLAQRRPFDALTGRGRLTGVALASYPGLLVPTDFRLGEEIGPSHYFESAAAALTYAHGYPQASAVIEEADGRFHLYGLSAPYYLQNERLANALGPALARVPSKFWQYPDSARSDTTGFIKKDGVVTSSFRLEFPPATGARVVAIVTSDLPTITHIDKRDGRLRYGIMPNYVKKADEASTWQRVVLRPESRSRRLSAADQPAFTESEMQLATLEALDLARGGIAAPLVALPPQWLANEARLTLADAVSCVRLLLRGPTIDSQERAILKLLMSVGVQEGKSRARALYANAAAGRPIDAGDRHTMQFIETTLFPLADFLPKLAAYRGLSREEIYALRFAYAQQCELLRLLAISGMVPGAAKVAPEDSLLSRLEEDLDGDAFEALISWKERIESDTRTELSRSLSSLVDAPADGVSEVATLLTTDMADLEYGPYVEAVFKGLWVLFTAKFLGDPEAEKKLDAFCERVDRVWRRRQELSSVLYEATVGEIIKTYQYHKHNGSLSRFWGKGGVVVFLNVLLVKDVPGLAQIFKEAEYLANLRAASRAGGIVMLKNGRVVVNPRSADDLVRIVAEAERLLARALVQAAAGTQSAKETRQFAIQLQRLVRDLHAVRQAATSTGKQVLARRYGRKAARRLARRYDAMSTVARKHQAQALRVLWQRSANDRRRQVLADAAAILRGRRLPAGARAADKQGVNQMDKVRVRGVMQPVDMAMTELQTELWAMQQLLPRQWPQAASVSGQATYMARLRAFDESLAVEKQALAHRAGMPCTQAQYEAAAGALSRLRARFAAAQSPLESAYALYDKARLGERISLALIQEDGAVVSITRNVPELWAMMGDELAALEARAQALLGSVALYGFDGSRLAADQQALVAAFDRLYTAMYDLPQALSQTRYDQFRTAAADAGRCLETLETQVYPALP